MTKEQMEAQIAQLQAENAALKAKKAGVLSCKVTEKGGLSVYGLGRFPVTLYKSQWKKLIGFIPQVEAFIAANDEVLTEKPTAKTEAVKAA